MKPKTRTLLATAVALSLAPHAMAAVTAYTDDAAGKVSEVTVDGTTYDSSSLIGGTMTAFSDPNAVQLLVGDGGSVPAAGSRAGLVSDLSLSTGFLNISGSFTLTFDSAVVNRTGTDLLIWDWGAFNNDTFDITINGTTFNGAGDMDGGASFNMNLPTGASYVQGPGKESDWFASTTDPVGSLASLESAAFSATSNTSTTLRGQ